MGVPCPAGQHCLPARCTSGLTSSTVWPAHVISGGVNGADGSDFTTIGGRDCVVSPYEQSQHIVISCLDVPANVQKMWPSATILTGVPGAEDSRWFDFDGDGFMDVVSVGQNSTTSVRISFAPASTALATMLNAANWTSISLTAASGVDSWIDVVPADINGDGLTDIVAGGRSLIPSTIRYFVNPGPGSARTAAAWTAVTMGNVGWTMSMVPMDVDADTDIDLVISDRDNGAGLRGVRYLENQTSGTVFVNHSIFVPAIGEESKMLEVANMDGDSDLDIIVPVSGVGYNRVFLLTNPGTWAGVWTSAELSAPSNVGQGQSVDSGDIDLDGDIDIAVTYSACNGALDSCAVWLSAPSWSRNEVSGPTEGEKYDKVILRDGDGDGDFDFFTSDQLEGAGTFQRGSIWHENCR